jgi:superfamily I DNA and RNA helicase
MAVMIPDSISSLENVTSGEKRVFKFLKETLPSDYIVWFDLRVNNRYPDFIILGPDLGIIVLEIKDWQIGSIKSADKNNFELKTMGITTNPIDQARTYMFNIVNELKKDKKLKNDKGYLKFTYGHGVIFTRIAKKSFLDSPFSDTVDENYVIFQDEFKNMEDNMDESYIIQRLMNMIPFKIKNNPLGKEEINRIRGTLFKEVKLAQDNESILKVMNINQEQLAKGLGYGHRVIRGVAGSGKTVILMCRAKYLAQLHKDWKILVVCFNKTLSTFLKNSIVDENMDNIEVTHFHGLINDISKKFNLKVPVYNDIQVSNNISRMSDDMISSDMKYDAILIDEAQDMHKDWIEFVVKLLRNPEHSHLLISSDGAQNLYNRNYNFKSVGIKAKGRTKILRENYRNTKQILKFGHDFLMDDTIVKTELNYDEEDNNFFIHPDMSLREGEMPKFIYCLDFKDEVEKIAQNIKQLKKEGISYRDICILHPHNSYKDIKYPGTIEDILKLNNIPYRSISKSSKAKSNFQLDDGNVKISTIYSAKGLDFKVVFICGLNDNLVEKGYSESKKLLYVGMTRARDILNITYSVHNDIVKTLIRAYNNIGINEEVLKTQEHIACSNADMNKKNIFSGPEIFEDEEKIENKGLFSKIKALFNV